MLGYPQTSSTVGQVNGDPVWPHSAGYSLGPPAPPHLPVMDQFPPSYAGSIIRPLMLADGRYSWEQVTEHTIMESDAKLIELIRRDLGKNKVDQALKDGDLNDTRKRHIYRLLENRVTSEGNSGMTWKLASVKLTKEISMTKKGNVTTRKTNVTSIRLIMKRVQLSVPRPGLHQSVLHRAESHFPEKQPVLSFGDPRVPQYPTPILHQDFGDHGNPGVLFGETMHSPQPSHQHPGMIRMDSPRETSEDYFEEDSRQHRSHKKNGKKGKDKDRSEPIDIYVPKISSHARHSSKHSSRPTSWADSDGASLFESPLTSVSNSPHAGVFHDSKYHGKHYKGYRGQGSDGSYRNRAGDDFVVVPNSRRHKHNRSMNSHDNVATGLSHLGRREPEHHDDNALISTINRLNLEEYDRKVQERHQLQRDLQLESRLGNIESLLHQKNREVVVQERPQYNRRFSDNYDIGYSSVQRRRHGDRYM